MDNWNPENLINIDTDEYKYLNEIKELISLSKDITEELNNIFNCQRYSILLKKEKQIHNFSDIKSKLEELMELF